MDGPGMVSEVVGLVFVALMVTGIVWVGRMIGRR